MQEQTIKLALRKIHCWVYLLTKALKLNVVRIETKQFIFVVQFF